MSKAASSLTDSHGTESGRNSCRLLVAWILASILSVAVPLVLFGVSWYKYEEEETFEDEHWWWQHQQQQGQYNQGGNWYWADDSSNKRNKGELGAILFVYGWSLLLFTAMILYGINIIAGSRPRGGLLSAITWFTNLALVCAVLVGALGIERQDDDQEFNGLRFLAQFPTCVMMTYSIWTVFGIIFKCILFMRSSSNHPLSEVNGPQGGPMSPISFSLRQATNDTRWTRATVKTTATAIQRALATTIIVRSSPEGESDDDWVQAGDSQEDTRQSKSTRWFPFKNIFGGWGRKGDQKSSESDFVELKEDPEFPKVNIQTYNV